MIPDPASFDELPEDSQHSIRLLKLLEDDIQATADMDSTITRGQEIARDGEAADIRIGQLVLDIRKKAAEDGKQRMARKEADPDTGKPIDEYTVDQYERKAIETFAKSLSHAASWAYDRAQLFSFYGKFTLARYHGKRIVGKEHLLRVMRKITATYPDMPTEQQVECAVGFIDGVLIPNTATVKETSKLLADTFGGKQPTSIRFAGRVVADDDGELWIQPLDALTRLQVGKVYLFTAREDKG